MEKFTPQQKMVAQSFNLEVVRLASFGIAQTINNNQKDPTHKDEDFPVQIIPDTDTPVGVSFFGRPIFSNLEIPSFTYYDNDRNLITTDALKIDAVLFGVGLRKSYTVTEIAGGTPIIEYCSNGSYEINIKAVLVNPFPNQTPNTQAAILSQMLDSTKSFNVNSSFLNNIFNISKIFVTDAFVNQMEGEMNIIQVQINAISDKSFNLIIKK